MAGPNDSTSSSGKPAESQIPVTAPFDLLQQLESAINLKKVIETNLPITADFYKTVLDDFNKMETAVTNIALKFGGNRDMVNEIKSTINLATASVVQLGGSLDDVVKIQEGVIKGLGTQTILNEESFKDIYAIGNLISDGSKTSAESTAKLTKEFADAGIGIYQMTKDMGNLITTARQMGVATSAVYAQLTQNIAKLNTFNFDNGVQGMSKMAAQAAGLRIDMSKTLSIADGLFDPEKAIQMAGDFQRLGVEVTNLLDPYKLMDMARNDPAQLQSSIIEMTKSLTYFDEKNQKMSILPGAQGQLRELAKVLGMSTEELAKMAVNSSDLERKMSQIKFSGAFASEEDRQMVAHMAQLGKQGTEFEGKYVVQLDDGTGNVITKAVDQLTETDKKRFEKQMEEAKKDPAQLQREANSYLTNIANNTAMMVGLRPRAIAASKAFNEVQKEVGQRVENIQQAAGESMGIKYQGKSGFADVRGLTERTQTMGADLFNYMLESAQKVSQGTLDAKDLMTDIMTQAKSLGGDFMREFSTMAIRAKSIAQSKGQPYEYNQAQKMIDATLRTLNPNYVPATALPMTNNTNILSNNFSNTNTNTNVNSNMTNSSQVSVNGVIEHKFPDNLQTIWNMALNDPNWMSSLQKKLSEIRNSNNALIGSGQ